MMRDTSFQTEGKKKVYQIQGRKKSQKEWGTEWKQMFYAKTMNTRDNPVMLDGKLLEWKILLASQASIREK